MPIEITFEQNDEGGWTAECPKMPGCISEGDTLPEAIKNMAEAVELWKETSGDAKLDPLHEIVDWLEGVIKCTDDKIDDLLESVWMHDTLTYEGLFNLARAAAYQDMVGGLKQLKRKIEEDWLE